MKKLLNQFKSLTDDEKLAFMKEAMAGMMPFCMNMMKTNGMNMNMDMDMMRHDGNNDG